MNLQNIELRFFDSASADYEQELMLRQKILRTPLGLILDPEKLKLENHDFHLGAFHDQRLLGCLILSPDSNQILKMRQVAVDDTVQGMGIGKQMVLKSETFAREKNYIEIRLSARVTAIPFYETLGYTVYGDPFLEIGLPHRYMSKNLSP
jgi:predicted GNAT family N-acyltransferase